MRRLALHQITALEASPQQLVSLAAEAGCERVCIFVRAPDQPIVDRDGSLFRFPTVLPDEVADMKACMEMHGISIMNAEFFPIEEYTDWEIYIPALDLANALGAERIVVHVNVTDETRAVQSLTRICDLAADRALKVGLEFMGISPGCNSLARALHFVEQAGRPNLGVAIDALHLIRTGGTIEEVAALHPQHIAYVQLCDGAGLDRCDDVNDYFTEAFDRLAPGEGVFPLAALMRALPPQVDVDIEVPSRSREKRGELAIDRVRRAVEASFNLLSEVAAN